MALVESAIPSLINGVSQQSPFIRLPSQCEEQVNAIADPVKGLRPRPPSIITNTFADVSLDKDDITTHLINRDDDQRYQLVVSQGTLKVFDLDTGEEKTVTFDTPTSYLSAGSGKSFDKLRFLTVADYTFIANTSVQVAGAAPTKELKQENEVLFHVIKGDYGTDYSLGLNFDGNNITAEWTTPTSNRPSIDTSSIAGSLMSQLQASINAIYGTGDYVNANEISDEGLEQFVTRWDRESTDGYSLELLHTGNWLKFKVYHSNPNTSVPQITGASAADGLGDTGFKVAFKKVEKISDLPSRAPTGYQIKVDGQDTDSGDEYYVEFNGESWEEVPYSDRGIASSTAPHALVHNPDGSFVFQQITYDRRRAGDDSLNPVPSFVGNYIADLVFFKDRLGFIADENIILSEVSEPFNFFRTTMLQLLDSDPVDVSMNDDQIAKLRYALPFDGELLVFSDSAQFSVKGEGLLSPTTISSDVVTRFEMDSKVKPQGTGRSVFFAQPYGDLGKVQEYYVDSESQVKDAADVTAHCPKYIQGKIKELSTSTTNKMVAATVDGVSDTVYIYHFFWQGNEKVQSSWSKWTFPNFEIISCDFLEQKLHILFYHPLTDRYYLEFIDLSDSYLVNHPYPDVISDILIDHLEVFQTKASISTPLLDVVDGWHIVDSDNVSYANTSEVPDETGITYHTGYPLNFSYTFSQFVMPSPSRGKDLAAMRGRLQLKHLLLYFKDSAKFDVDISIENRPTSTKAYDSRIVGSGNIVVGGFTRDTGKFSVPIKAEASKVNITIKNDSFLPCSFHGAEWEAWYQPRSRRV